MRNLIFAVLVLAILAGGIFAAGGKWGLKEGSDNSEKTVGSAAGSGEVENEKETSDDSVRNGAGQASSRYEEAKKNYEASLAQMREKRGSVVERGKGYVSNAVTVLQKMLEVANEHVDKANGLSENEKAKYREGIREREDELEQIEGNLTNATSVKDVIEQAKHVREEWRDARQAARVTIGGIGVKKVGEAIEMGWKAENSTEALIGKCGQAGFDVSGANTHLEQFREQLSLAEQENDLANAIFGNSTNSTNATDGYAHLREAQKHMIEAKKIAQEFKDDLKQCVLKQGHVAIVGNGWLHAIGSGRAEISGNGTVEANFTGNSSSGKVTVIDRAGDAVISVTGGNEVKDKENETEKEFKYVKVKVYVGAGSVTVSGSRMTVILNSNGMELYAKGTGMAILSGNGSYETGAAGNSTAAQTGAWRGNGAAVRIAEERGED